MASEEILFQDTTTAWIIEQAVPLLIALASLLLAIVGFKQTFKNIAKEHQHQFQIKTYEKLTTLIEEANSTGSTYSAFIESLNSQISMNSLAEENGHLPTDLKKRSEDYMQQHFDYLRSITKVMIALESIYIIEPKLKIFSIALGAVHHDLSELYDKISEYTFRCSYRNILDKAGEDHLVPPENITAEEKIMIENVVRQIVETSIDGTCYLLDLKAELQNLLLGEVYTINKAPFREPLDPKKQVISVAKYDALSDFFANEHPAGKKQKEVQELLKKQLAS